MSTAIDSGRAGYAFIQPVNQAVPGRLRLKVAGLRRSERIKSELETRIVCMPAVLSVRANPLTGNVLVIFDHPHVALPQLLTEIDALIRGLQQQFAIAPLNTSPAPAGESRVKGFFGRFGGHGSAKASGPEETTGETPETRALSRTLETAAEAPPGALWHAEPVDRVMSKLNTSSQGLAASEVNQRLALYGRNVLGESKPRSALKILMEQFLSAPVAMLGVSAAVSIVTGGIADAVVIVGVVMINAVIGYVTESSAERTINALGKMTPTRALVIRGGREVEIPADQVVVGDLLVLTPGSFVAADARLIETHRLTIDESALTGESIAVRKRSEFVGPEDTPLGDRKNMAHMGTIVTGGSGLAVVAATGKHTEIGLIQSLVGEVAPPDTPMQRQLDHLGTQLALMSSGICAAVFGIGILRGYGWLHMLTTSISLAVAAVPEGLPAVATTTLALGIRDMQRRQVLIRQLPAVETLGSVQVLCFDKTGTLTLNQMKVVAIATPRSYVDVRDGRLYLGDDVIPQPVAQQELHRLLQIVSLCSEVKLNGHEGIGIGLEGSPTESALVEAAMVAGLDVQALRAGHPLVKIEHRSENRPYMSTIHQDQGGHYLVAVKGSPAEVLKLCHRGQMDGEIFELDEEHRAAILGQNDAMAGEALRVLGVAYVSRETEDAAAPHGLIWLGLIGMEDAIRPGMDRLMAQFHEAGIRTVMITGDQSATAYSVGKRLRLNDEGSLNIIDSNRLDKLEPEILSSIVKDTAVFARVSPGHKLKIVQALQATGQVIAMTGDGVNDSPALRAADIGVAMGQRGTDVARSVSDVVLQDDNLHTMVAAVEQGRTIYNNIRKSVRFLLSTNISEIEVMMACVALGMGEALNPLQLLWINLMTDIFPALALAMEPPESDVLKQAPRRPDEPIVRKKDFLRILKDSTTITVGSMGVYGYSVARYGLGPQASSNTFQALTLAQFFQAIVCRSEETTLLSRDRPGNSYLRRAILASLAVQSLTVLLPPLRRILHLSPPAIGDLIAILVGAGLPFVVNEATKTLSFDNEEISQHEENLSL
jgi:Ca2+-transporting ATPase